MMKYQITLTIEIDAKDEAAARELAAKYKDKVSRLVVKPRDFAIVPTRVLEVKEKS
jgi:hypothetical protein